MNYTLSYDFNSQLNCGVICFNEHSILVGYGTCFFGCIDCTPFYYRKTLLKIFFESIIR